MAANGFILPVVLVLVGLLALLAAGFTFFTRAETAGAEARINAHQARLAAESGLEEVVSMIRAGRDDSTMWLNRPQRLRHGLVWSEAFNREEDPVRSAGNRVELLASGSAAIAWRFSAVAPNYDDPNAQTIRYGITPESSRLSLNAASDQQIEQLLAPLLAGLQLDNPQALINALLDWRDQDTDPRDGGAENEYYNALEPPYLAKNAPFDTVEELLLVKGFNAAILYGEDVNRNGLLDPNENDGDASFPYYDNADGTLNLGIAPFLTVWTREPDTSLDNKPRVNLAGDRGMVQGQLALLSAEQADPDTPTLDPATLAFIQGLIGQNFNFGQLRSAADLYAGDDELLDEGEGDATGATGGGGIPPQLANSPITLEEMPVIMDRLSVVPPQQAQQGLIGLININTAPRRVLELVPGMPAQAAELIVNTRGTLDAATLTTTAWPLTTGTVDSATFKQIAPYITTKAYQFHVEVIGYADHAKLMRRYEWVIEMIGPLAQVKYHRDLTRLGMAWPIDDENALVPEAR
jgi:type II secretory pathway component PulK